MPHAGEGEKVQAAANTTGATRNAAAAPVAPNAAPRTSRTGRSTTSSAPCASSRNSGLPIDTANDFVHPRIDLDGPDEEEEPGGRAPQAGQRVRRRPGSASASAAQAAARRQARARPRRPCSGEWSSTPRSSRPLSTSSVCSASRIMRTGELSAANAPSGTCPMRKKATCRGVVTTPSRSVPSSPRSGLSSVPALERMTKRLKSRRSGPSSCSRPPGNRRSAMKRRDADGSGGERLSDDERRDRREHADQPADRQRAEPQSHRHDEERRADVVPLAHDQRGRRHALGRLHERKQRRHQHRGDEPGRPEDTGERREDRRPRARRSRLRRA